jgi:pimeloyl-ACP methyl ester carboxylesterase
MEEHRMKRTAWIFRLVLLCGAIVPNAFALGLGLEARLGPPDRVETREIEPGVLNHCEWFTSKQHFNLCITTTQGSRNPDILWYMHGASGSEKRWAKRYGEVRAAWRAQGYEPPVVVTISFGPVWLLAEKNPKATSGLFEYVTRTVIPMIEERLGGLQGRRLVLGESMGGFNTSQLVMKRPELFAKAVILCPAITTIGPFSKWKEITAFKKRNKGSRWDAVLWDIVMQRVFYPDQESWDSADALKIGPRYLGPWTPPLYIGCGQRDQFAFYEGASAYQEIAKAAGASVIWDDQPGGHCSFDPREVALFLSRP